MSERKPNKNNRQHGGIKNYKRSGTDARKLKTKKLRTIYELRVD